jgi:hypothetical protein
MLKPGWVTLICTFGRIHIGASFIQLFVPSEITHNRGADPLGSPLPYPAYSGLRPSALRTALSCGLPLSSWGAFGISGTTFNQRARYYSLRNFNAKSMQNIPNKS